MKNNTAILNCDTKEIEIMVEGAEISFDLNEGDIEDYWNSFGVEFNSYDINFSMYGGNPFVSVYKVQNGKRNSVGLTLEIVEIIGSIEALVDYFDEDIIDDNADDIDDAVLEITVMNQMEGDFHSSMTFELSVLVQKLIENEETRKMLVEYITNKAKEISKS